MKHLYIYDINDMPKMFIPPGPHLPQLLIATKGALWSTKTAGILIGRGDDDLHV